MAYEFKLPDLGEGLTEGEVARWLVAEGDVIDEDDPLVEIQTDKTTVEIPSPAAGTVLRILVAEGQVAPVGTVLVVIGDEGEQLLRSVEPEPAAEPVNRARRRGRPARTTCSRASDTPGAPDRAGPRRRSGHDQRHRAGARVTEEDVRARGRVRAGPFRPDGGRRLPRAGVSRCAGSAG